MKKIALCMVLVLLMCGLVCPTRPAEALLGIDLGVGALLGSVIVGTAEGCWKAYKAPEGKKWEEFKEGFKEGAELGSVGGGFVAY